jgi:hypothetical protein
LHGCEDHEFDEQLAINLKPLNVVVVDLTAGGWANKELKDLVLLE